MIIFLFLNLLVFTILVIPNWNIGKTSINLLDSSNTKVYDITHRDMYGLNVRLEKTITKLNNGTITHFNVLYTNDTPSIINVSYEHIESFYKINGKKILCPIGRYDPINLETNLEITNNNKEENDDFKIKCYSHNAGFFFVFYFGNSDNQTYDLSRDNLEYTKYEKFQFYEELYDFKLVNKESEFNGPFPICALAKKDNYIQIFGTSFNLIDTNITNIGKGTETNKTLIEAKTYSQGYFNNYTKDFYYITYNNISDFTSGYSTSTVSNYDNLDPVNVLNNYNSPFEFLEEVEIKEMQFLLYTNYVYYSIYNKITGKTYHGIFNVITNKIVFNTDEDLDAFIPYSNFSMLAITKDTAYQICIIKDGNSDTNFQCIESCLGNIILDTDGNYCDNSCGNGKLLLIPEEICISDCNTSIYIKNSTHCGLCRDMNNTNKYKIIGGENCIESNPEGGEIYNADLYLLKCKSGYILEGSTCVPHCYDNCYRCSEYSTDYFNQKCISCIDNHYLAGNAPNNCLFNCTGDNKIKCATCNNESDYLGLCLTCSKGYYKVNYTTLYPHLKYFDCLKEDLLKKFFLDEQNEEYKPCYKTCKRCKREGNETAHYCLECESDYMFRPGNNTYNNCIAESSYYYVSPYGQIKSMDILQCPEEAKYLIKNKSSCIYSCKEDSTYKWLYNGNCVEQCPSGTQKVNYICLVDSNTCTLGTNDLILKNNSLDIINTYATTYISEFNYTNKHITQYINNNYTIILFKAASCIKELKLELPYPDFKQCYTKVQNAYNINENLLVSLVEVKLKLNNPVTLFTFFHPKSGEKLDSEIICKNEKITLVENLYEILDEDNDYYNAQISLTEQGINIFDINDPFFTDICFDFDNPLKKDIPLNSRIQDLYPNVSVCDKGCQYNGIDLDGMTASCDCTFNDITNNELLKDSILSDTLGELFDFIGSSNLQVFKCFQYIFKHFSRSIGGWISLFIIVVHITMVILYFIFELGKIKVYIFSLTKKYVEYVSKINKSNNNNFPPKKVTLIDAIRGDKKKKKKYNKENHHVKIFNPKKDNSDAKSVGEGLSKSKFQVKNSEDKKLITMGNNKKHFHLISSDSKTKKEKEKEKEDEIQNNNIIINHLTKDDIDIVKKEEKEKNNINVIINLNTLSKNDIAFFEEYLETSPDEMEYDEALYFDKRTFLAYFSECLKEKQIIAHTFIAKDELKPRTMKIIVFSLNMLLYFVVNGLLFSEDVITELYELDEDKEKFFSYFLRSIRRIIYSTLVSIVINIIVDFFFVGEDKLKHIYKKQKMSPQNLKELIAKFINDIAKRNISVIIICSILLLFSFFYLLCFNYVYPYSQIEWIKSSITILIIMQFLSFFKCFCESGFRILSFRTESEKLFKISKMID